MRSRGLSNRSRIVHRAAVTRVVDDARRRDTPNAAASAPVLPAHATAKDVRRAANSAHQSRRRSQMRYSMPVLVTDSWNSVGQSIAACGRCFRQFFLHVLAAPLFSAPSRRGARFALVRRVGRHESSPPAFNDCRTPRLSSRQQRLAFWCAICSEWPFATQNDSCRGFGHDPPPLTGLTERAGASPNGKAFAFAFAPG